MTKTVCISFAIGCPRSMLDSALLVDYFIKNDWEITTEFHEADIVLVGSCGVDISNENRSMKYLSIADRKKIKKGFSLVSGVCPVLIKQNFLKNLI